MKDFLQFLSIQFSYLTEGCKKLCCNYCPIESSVSSVNMIIFYHHSPALRVAAAYPSCLGAKAGLQSGQVTSSSCRHIETNNIYVYGHKGEGGFRGTNQANSHLWDVGKQVHSKRTSGLTMEPVAFLLWCDGVKHSKIPCSLLNRISLIVTAAKHQTLFFLQDFPSPLYIVHTDSALIANSDSCATSTTGL